MIKTFSVLCLAITAGIAFGAIGWEVASGGALIFLALAIHRFIARLGLVRACRLVGSWFWSAAFGIEEHRRRMQEAVTNIQRIESGSVAADVRPAGVEAT